MRIKADNVSKKGSKTQAGKRFGTKTKQLAQKSVAEMTLRPPKSRKAERTMTNYGDKKWEWRKDKNSAVVLWLFSYFDLAVAGRLDPEKCHRCHRSRSRPTSLLPLLQLGRLYLHFKILICKHKHLHCYCWHLRLTLVYADQITQSITCFLNFKYTADTPWHALQEDDLCLIFMAKLLLLNFTLKCL